MGKKLFLDLWGLLFIGTIAALSVIGVENTFLVMGLYLLLSVPLFKHTEYLLGVCYTVSTISYYFAGADEGVYSIYTILLLALLFSVTRRKRHSGRRIRIKDATFYVLLVVAALVSFSLSSFGYSNGFFLIAYNVIVAIAVILFPVFISVQ